MTRKHTPGLLPCPFCGGEAEVERHGDRRQSHIIFCTGCGCTLETGETWNAGSAWNTRFRTPAERAAPELLEALKGLVAISDDHGPFGGEIYRDRVDRAWDVARVVIRKAEGKE